MPSISECGTRNVAACISHVQNGRTLPQPKSHQLFQAGGVLHLLYEAGEHARRRFGGGELVSPRPRPGGCSASERRHAAGRSKDAPLRGGRRGQGGRRSCSSVRRGVDYGLAHRGSRSAVCRL